MSVELHAERWRLVELLQVRALKIFLSRPEARRLERFDDGLRPAWWRYVPEHASEKIRAAMKAAEERRLNRPMPPRYREQLERLNRETSTGNSTPNRQQEAPEA